MKIQYIFPRKSAEEQQRAINLLDLMFIFCFGSQKTVLFYCYERKYVEFLFSTCRIMYNLYPKINICDFGKIDQRTMRNENIMECSDIEWRAYIFVCTIGG